MEDRRGSRSRGGLSLVGSEHHGNERSYNGLRLAIMADRVQEPRP
jgi:hypothetical protein